LVGVEIIHNNNKKKKGGVKLKENIIISGETFTR